MLLGFLIIGDTHKDDLSTVTLEGIRIVLCLDLVNSGLYILIPFQLDQQNRILRIVFREIGYICIALTGRQFFLLHIVISVGVVCQLDHAAKAILLIVMQR